MATMISEHQIQSSFFDWIRLSQGKYPELKLCFAVPNAAKRSPGLAAWLRAEGMKAGVPDVLLLAPRGGYSGLALEFKRPGGKPTAIQDLVIADMRCFGWRVDVVIDAEEAIRIVKNYLE